MVGSQMYSLRHGHVEVICGCMFSGKSEELIRRLRRAVIAKQAVQVFKPVIDNRYSSKAVVSHTRVEFPAEAVQSPGDILFRVNEQTQVVGIDEAQFFHAGIVDVVETLANQGRRVIVAGLDQDAFGQPFGPMPQLMAVAEFVDKIHAVCTVCGEPASRSYRKTGSQQQVEVGADQYEARCRHHWKDEK